MGVASLIIPTNQPQPTGQVQAIAPTFGDVYGATLEASELNFQSYSRDRAQGMALEDRETLFEKQTGQKVKDATGAAYDDPVLRYSKLDEIITEGRQAQPDIYGSIPTSDEVQQNARGLARTTQSKADGIQAEAGGASGVLASFAGEFVAGAQDPVNAAAMLIPGGGEAKGFLAVSKKAAEVGAANAGVTALQQPSVASWQREIGNEYGLGEAASQVGMAFMFGGVADLGLRGVTSSVRFARGKTNDILAKRRGEVPPSTGDEVADAVLPHLTHQESGGKQFAADGSPLTSEKGAVGTMQVMPQTGPEAARLAGLEWNPELFARKKTGDPIKDKEAADYSTALGSAYFKKQLDTYGSPEVALLAYNAGPGAVSDFMHGTNATGKNPKGLKLGDPQKGDISPQEFVRQFPFKESREYASKIMGDVHGTKPDLAPYMGDAKNIKEFLETTPVIDTSTPQGMKDALGYKPKSLSQFVKESGGIRDAQGELAARDITHRSLPGLVRKSKEGAGSRTLGKDFATSEAEDIDHMRQRVFDEGYFPSARSYEDISESDLYDAIANDLNGQKVYRGDDLERAALMTEGSEAVGQYDRMGISKEMSHEEIAEMLHAHNVPDEFAVHDTASRYFDAIASSPETPPWARSSYAHMAEYADALATSPFERDTPANRERHMQNLAVADDAIRNGERPVPLEKLDYEGVRPKFGEARGPSREKESRVGRPVSSREIADVLKPEEVKQFQATQRRDFEQRVENTPESTVTMDDGRTITMRELADEIKESERHLDEIKTCGLG